MLALRPSVQLRKRLTLACHNHYSKQSQSLALSDNEYAEPHYPKILDTSFKARKTVEVTNFHEVVRNVPTVEEKLIKINMPRYYGYKVVQLSDEKLPYNCLPAIQHYTRTSLEEVEEAKALTSESKQQRDAFAKSIKGDVEGAIEYANDFFKCKYKNRPLTPAQREHAFTQAIIEQVNRTLVGALSADCPHLQEVEVDCNPRHEAFWAVGGIDPPKNVVKSKEGRDWQKPMSRDAVDRLMQYAGSPYLTIRHLQQLPPWKTEAETKNAEFAKQIPRFNYDPRTLGYVTGYQHGTNIPGYWPDSASNFGLISYQSRAHMLIRPESYGADDFKEALHAQAVQSSYAWLLAQANYNGFNTYNDLTYPMNTQTIITNGREWSFYEYQLNTLLIHSNHIDNNPRVNFCRGTANPLQLYAEIDESGKCIGFNETVLQYLVSFYCNAPTIKRDANDLRPYLGAGEKRIADYENDEQRRFLERIFKHMTSNRPRHLATPEIYLWEKIYKIDNQTRQMEAKRRFFELDINPWKRTMDQHQKEYIPRAVRPEGPRSRKKWKQMYYP